MYYTYILKCSDNYYYVGSTNSLLNRLHEHNSGKAANYTAKRLPCFIVWHDSFQNRIEATGEEFRIKKLSRIKKENLIFSKGTVWEHFKGNKYIILNIFDNLICYAELEKWQKFVNNQEKNGRQLQVWLRDKNQWLDIKNNKTLRFSRIHGSVAQW